MAAFAHALALGYDYLETDVHSTADDVLVAFHDDDLERVAGLPGRVSDHSWDELAEVRLADVHPIPRLADLLERFPAARFNIDPKSDQAALLLIDLLRDYDAIDRVCVGSFSDERVEQIRRELGSGVCTSPGPNGVLKVLAAALFFPWWKPPYGCIQIPTQKNGIPLTGRLLIRRVQRLGLHVHYWTINDERQMAQLLQNGADGIITDEIELFRRVLGDHRLD